MSFQQGLSGLSAASANLDVIGNNVANVNTVGFKQSQAQFADVFSVSLDGSGASDIGGGARVAAIAQEFSQGAIATTSNPLDIAIRGQGFFRMNDNGVISYSRNGQFHPDANGYLVDATNTNLTGNLVDATGNIVAGNPANLRLPTAGLAAQATTNLDWGFNLDSRLPLPSPVPVFDATNSDTYQSTRSATIFDSLGNSHIFQIYFQKSAANTWDTHAAVDGKLTNAGLPVGITLSAAQLVFDTNGKLTNPVAPIDVSVDLTAIDPALGATAPLDFKLDLTSSTQYGLGFSDFSLSQDGYTAGDLVGFKVGANGLIQGSYSNNQTRTLGQVVLANFANPQGLDPIGDNHWVETPASGQPLIGPPTTGTFGELQGSAVESANVDLTAELVKMITAQRMYQANAKTIETQNSIMQTLVNL